MFLLTSYPPPEKEDGSTDTKVSPSPIKSLGKTQTSMLDCVDKTREFAKTKCDPPENSRSDPADRIYRFKNAIDPQTDDKKIIARNSKFYKDSLKLLLQCVLAQIYDEKVSIKPLKVEELYKEEEKGNKGRRHFVDAILKNLNMGDNKNILTLRNRAERIIGLLSSAGPIPVAEEIFSLQGLEIDEKKNLKGILSDLEDQDKEILAFWLKKVGKSSCFLYTELITELKKATIDIDVFDFRRIEEIMEITENYSGVPCFPVLKKHGEAVLCDRITVIPIGGR